MNAAGHKFCYLNSDRNATYYRCFVCAESDCRSEIISSSTRPRRPFCNYVKSGKRGLRDISVLKIPPIIMNRRPLISWQFPSPANTLFLWSMSCRPCSNRMTLDSMPPTMSRCWHTLFKRGYYWFPYRLPDQGVVELECSRSLNFQLVTQSSLDSNYSDDYVWDMDG